MVDTTLVKVPTTPLKKPTHCVDCLFGQGAPLACCRHGFKNGDTNCVKLLHDAPNVEMYVPKWLYDKGC